MELFGKKLVKSRRDICDEETSGYRTDASAQGEGDVSLADIIPEVAVSPAAAKAVADIVAISHWTCSSCRQVNSGTVACQQCGQPLSDEALLAPLRAIASVTAAEESVGRMPM